VFFLSYPESNPRRGISGTAKTADTSPPLSRLLTRPLGLNRTCAYGRSCVQRCAVCGQTESEHAKTEHEFKLDTSIPSWHGWHAFRRGLATNLHTLGVDDKTIQAILRHSNVGLTINVYIKSVTESQANAMDVLSARLEQETNNNLATGNRRLVN